MPRRIAFAGAPHHYTLLLERFRNHPLRRKGYWRIGSARRGRLAREVANQPSTKIMFLSSKLGRL
jgi:hypothetical protein